MKKNSMKKSLLSLCALVFAASTLSSCSYLIYSIYDNNRTSEILSSLEEEEKSKTSSEDTKAESFKIQSYGSKTVTDGALTIKLLTVYSSTEYSLDLYEEANGGNYIKTAFHMDGTYTRDGNVLTLAAGFGYKTTCDGTNYSENDYLNPNLSDEQYAETRTKALKDVWGDNLSVALNSDDTFVFGGTSDSTDALEGDFVKNYRWDELSSRKFYRSLSLFSDGTYFVTTSSSTTANKNAIAATFMGYSAYTEKTELATDEYKVVTLANDGKSTITQYYAGSSATVQAQSWSMYKNMVDTSYDFYVTDTGYTINAGKPSEKVLGEYNFYPYTATSTDSGNTETPTVEVSDDAAFELFTLSHETSDPDHPMKLIFNSDNTVNYTWDLHSLNYEMSWYIDDEGNLEIEEYNGATTTVTPDAIPEGKDSVQSYTLAFAQGQLTGTFSMTAGQLALLKAENDTFFTDFYETSDKSKMILAFHNDGTLTFGWEKWSAYFSRYTYDIKLGYLTISSSDATDTVTVTYNDDGSATAVVGTASGMKGTFTVTASQIQKLKEREGIVYVAKKTMSDATMTPITLVFNDDGTGYWGWAKYNLSTGIIYEFDDDGVLSITSLKETDTIEITQDETSGDYTIKINEGGQVSGLFTMTAGQVKVLRARHDTLFTLQKVTSNGQDPIELIVRDDGTAAMCWSQYGLVYETTWSYNLDQFTINKLGDAAGDTVKYTYNEDGTMTIDIAKDGSISGTFTLDTYHAKLAKEEANVAFTLYHETTNGQKPITLVFYYDGTAFFGWAQYSVAYQYNWGIDNGALTLVENVETPDATHELTLTPDETAHTTAIHIKNGFEGNFTLSAAQLSILVDSQD